MAGSSMTFTEIVFGSVKKIKCVWLSDDGTGDVSGTTTNFYDGRILGACTVPDGVAPPDDNYNITVEDEDGVDIALGALLLRDTAITEFVAEALMAGVAHSALTVNITDAGNANAGVLYLYIR